MPLANLCKVCKNLEISKICHIEKPQTKANLCKVCKDLQARFGNAIFAQNAIV